MSIHIGATGTRRSLSRRVFATIFTIATLTVVVFSVAAAWYVQERLTQIAHTEIANQADIVAEALEGTPDDRMMAKRFALENTRITLIDSDGTVTYDSEEPADSLGNHAHRPEVAEALREGRGSAERSSTTLGEVMLYEAVRLDNGSVVRIAQAQKGLLTIFASMVVPLLVMVGVCALVAFIAARRESAKIIAPLLTVDLDHPVRDTRESYLEMAPMLDRIESQRQELKRQMRALADNDRMRREFTANITHELKTPLTAISGYAELISTGMVTNEDDLRDFAQRIHGEAGRLTSLVNDILTLSKLDEAERSASSEGEGVLGARELVDMARVVESVSERLEPLAARADVHIETETHSSVVEGLPRLLDELTYNLVSNAIRYNRPHGSVSVCVHTESDGVVLSVSDTGIGIAQEECDKIFERFYRVDKSRSKERGGTGLGLAIVKHAAALHAATIEVESKVGYGTTMVVHFAATPLPDSDDSQVV